MADRAVSYAQWLVNNKDKKGSPEFDTVAQAYKALRQQSMAPQMPEQKPEAGFFSALGEAATTLGAAPEAAGFAVAGDEEAKRAPAREALLKATESEYQGTAFSDIKNLGDAVDWLKQTGGAMAGYLAAPGAAAKLTQILMKTPGVAPKAVGYGVLGAQYALENLARQASTQEEQKAEGKEPEATSVLRAVTAAGGQTALDVAGFKLFEPFFGKFPLLKNLVGEGTERTAKETADVLSDAFERGTLRTRQGVVTGIGKGLTFEIPQEVAQQALERWQAGLSLTDAKARNEYFEAGAAAAIFGGALGGVSGGLEYKAAEDILRARAAEKLKAATPPEKTELVSDEERKEITKEIDKGFGESFDIGLAAVRKLGSGQPTNSYLNVLKRETGLEKDKVRELLKTFERQGVITPEDKETGLRTVRPVGPEVEEILGGFKETAVPQTTEPKITKEKKPLPWEGWREGALDKWAQSALEVGVPQAKITDFYDRLVKIEAAKTDPDANKFEMMKRIDKNKKIYDEISKQIAEGPAPEAFKKEPAKEGVEKAPTIPFERTEAPALDVSKTGEPTDADIQRGGEQPQPGGILGGPAVPLRGGPATGEPTEAAPTGLGLSGAPTERVTERKRPLTGPLAEDAARKAAEKEAAKKAKAEEKARQQAEEAARKQAEATAAAEREARRKEVSSLHRGIESRLSELGQLVPKTEEIPSATVTRDTKPATRAELKAIPTDVDGLLSYAQNAVNNKTLAPLIFNRIANIVRTARVQPGFNPATDLNGAREILAKAIRPVKPKVAETPEFTALEEMKAARRESEELEKSDDPAQRQRGEELRRAVDKGIGEFEKRYKKKPPEAKPVSPEAGKKIAQAVDNITFAEGLRGKTYEQAIQYMIDTAPTPAFKLIAQRVQAAAQAYKKVGVRLNFVTDARLRGGVRGRFTYVPSVQTGTVELDLKAAQETEALKIGGNYYGIVLHEFIHSVTTPALIAARADRPQLTKLRQDLLDVSKTVIKYYNARVKTDPQNLTPFEQILKNRGVNALQNEYEVLTWAMNSADFQKYLETIPYKENKSLWDKFVQSIRQFLGLDATKDTALSEILRITGRLLSPSAIEEMDAATNPLAEPTQQLVTLHAVVKKAAPKEAESPAQIEARLGEQLNERTGGKDNIAKAIKDNLTYKATEKAITNFQSERRPLKRLQDALEIAGKLILGDKGYNNLYDLIVLSSGRAYDYLMRDIQPSINNLHEGIRAFSKASNLDTTSALGRLHMYLMAQHEFERREVKFDLNRPLNNKRKIQFGNKIMTPAEARDSIVRLLYREKNLVDDGTAKELRKIVKQLGDTYGTPEMVKEGSFSPKGYKSTDITSPDYQVVGGYTYDEFVAMRDQLRRDPNKPLVDAIFKDLKALQKESQKLDKQANYWSQQTSNITSFYGYNFYVPFKGKPGKKVTGDEEKYDEGGDRIGGREFTEFAFGTEGRITDSDNPLLQTIIDGVKAATRAGRLGTSEAIKNLIEQKHLRGRLKEVITFEQRYNNYDPKELQKNNVFFHYTPNGNIEVYEVFESDRPYIEAIRRTFRANTPIWDKVNYFTSRIGSFHTRYNLPFHPYNFVRDVLTNTWSVGAEFGGDAAMRFLGAAARQVVDNGFYKAGTISALYNSGKVDQIKKMVFNADGSIKDQAAANVYEYLQEGGRVSYIMGLTEQNQVKDVLTNVSGSSYEQKKAAFNRVVDVWTDAFEFTSRAAAYGLMKSQYINQFTKDFQKKNKRQPNKAELAAIEKNARVRAATYAKELANFEQVGKYGKQAGALFMFFRPAATGAVRAIDALRPAFESLEQALSHLPESLRNDPEAVQKFTENYAERQKNAKNAIYALAGAGAFLYMMMWGAAGEDDEGRNRVSTDDMDLWTRNLRVPVKLLNPLLGKNNDFINIPWGFGGGAMMASGAQIASAMLGNQSVMDAAVNMLSITLDSFLPVPVARFNPATNPSAWVIDSVMPSVLRPLIEYQMNVDTFGKQIYNARTSKYGDAYTGGEFVPEAYKKLTRFLADVGIANIQPQTLFFFANNYADGVSRLIHNSYGVSLWATGNKDFDAKRDLFVLDSFIGKRSSVDARQLASVEKEINSLREEFNMYKNTGNYEGMQKFIERNPNAPALIQYYNMMSNGELRNVRERLNRISSSDLPPNQRQKLRESDEKLRDMYARNMVEYAKMMGVEP